MLFKLEVRQMHPEIVPEALVQLCQVVLLCKYVSSALFSVLAAGTSISIHESLSSAQTWRYWKRQEAVKYEAAVFEALKRSVGCF